MKKIGISILVLCLVLVFAFFKVPVQSEASSQDAHKTDFVVLSGTSTDVDTIYTEKYQKKISPIFIVITTCLCNHQSSVPVIFPWPFCYGK